ncbi:MAG: hypothetical protein OXF02_00380 [Simkaniaceae bacterium]|nr:hypothetical protein [Simkaniaceae bacterium]
MAGAKIGTMGVASGGYMAGVLPSVCLVVGTTTLSACCYGR